MDISISRLNNRMSLQVPAELPLGLVFIVGQVARLQRSRDGKVVFFELVEGRHRLPCRLPGRVARETLLREGDRVRAGGRLLFNSRLAGYLLVARDVEVLPWRSADPSLQSIIEDAQARKAQTQETRPQQGAAVQSDLPAWVTRLAPPEVRRELDLQAEVEVEDDPGVSGPGVGGPHLGESGSDGAGASPELDAVAAMETETPAESALSPEMVTFLSQAIDSDDDIELTAEMISNYLPQSPDGDPQTPPARTEATPQAPDDAPADRQQAPAHQPAASWRAHLPLLAALLVVLLLLAAVLVLILTQA
ncbi:MAG TPA: hypothetical protein VK879_05715 [Candidatus Sulfomarinibacteraceae bacterium]|nr:hypothetical protein [Candidatus Sulfomarinibacteraceae bacterium]